MKGIVSLISMKKKKLRTKKSPPKDPVDEGKFNPCKIVPSWYYQLKLKLLGIRRVLFQMVRKKRYRDRESTSNSFDAQPSKMKLRLLFYF